MNTQTQRGAAAKTVSLIGATGKLGGLIARELLDRGTKLRLLVRSSSRAKLAADLAAASEIAEDGANAFNGVHTVVSAVQGDAKTIVDAQLEWLRAARSTAVRRFIASDYRMN